MGLALGVELAPELPVAIKQATVLAMEKAMEVDEEPWVEDAEEGRRRKERERGRRRRERRRKEREGAPMTSLRNWS